MKVVYRGPGDALEMDGLRFEAGDEVAVTAQQFDRMRRSDPLAVVEVVSTGGDEVAILREQGRIRERAVRAERRAEAEAAAERDRLDAEAAARAAKEAADADARAERQAVERAKIRAEVAGGAISRKGA